MLPLVSHVKYVPLALVRLEKRRDRQTNQTDGRMQDRYITLAARRGQLKNIQICATEIRTPVV